MRLLVFGDVHGNLIALEKMLSKFSGSVDKLICHGDLVNYGPWSNECVKLIESIDCTRLIGNHERAYLNGEYKGSALVEKFFAHTFPKFDQFSSLKKYGESLKIENHLIKHTINNSYYYPDTDISKLTLEENTVIGHSHYPFIKQNGQGYNLINTGSVGQNRKNLSIINCAIIDTVTNDVKIESLEYNPSQIISEMKKQAYPIECLNYYLSKM
jgi:predicted phosphodiesterase